MKRVILFSLLLAPLVVFIYTIPFSWFGVDIGMKKTEMYTLCGLPTDVELRDIKGERWNKSGPYVNWMMYAGFDEGAVARFHIMLDLGTRLEHIRIHIMQDGEWALRM